MAQGADFRSRITLDGADKVVSDLKTIGAEGDKAFLATGKAADNASKSVTAFGRASELAARSMASFQQATAGLGQGFQNLHQHATNFGSALGDVANTIIPRWREILGLATLGGVAGFAKLFESTAKWGHELEENAKILGMTPGEFALIAKAATQAGIEVEKLVAGMARFQGEMQKIAEERKKLAGKTAVDLFGKDSGIGLENAVTIYRGGLKSIEAAIPLPKMEQWRDVAEEIFGQLQKTGQFKGVTLQRFLREVDDALRSGGERAAAIREDLNKWGANLPSAKLGERIEAAMPGFRDMFAQMGIPLFDKQTKEVREFTDVFGDFLDKFATLGKGEQFNIVREKFGRGFTDLIPLMQKGRAGMLEFFDAAKARGLDTSAFDKEIKSLDEAYKALVRLDSAIGRVRKALVVPFANVFTPLIDEWSSWISESQKDIKDWAEGIAAQARRVTQDLVGMLHGAEPTTEFGKGVRMGLDAIGVAVDTVKFAFNSLTAVMEAVTAPLNTLFGTNYTAQTYALAAAFLYFSGILPAVATGIRLVWAALQLIYATPFGLALAALAGAALLIYNNWDTLGPLFWKLWEGLKAFGSWLSAEWVKFWTDPLAYIVEQWSKAWEYTGLKALWDQLKEFGNWLVNQWTSFWTDPIQGIKDQWNAWFDWFAQKWQWFKSLVGSGGSPTSGAPVGAPSYATGGQVPGRGSGDIVPAMLTPGEFIIRKSIVDQLGVGFFSALNGGMGSLLPRGRYATGGLVMEGAGAGGTPVHLHLDGQSYSMRADSDVAESLLRAARAKQMLSAGRKPGWAGGRRYGG